MVASEVSANEAELLIHGLHDNVASDWVLIVLGLRANPPDAPGPPVPEEIEETFVALDRLSQAGLIKIGRIEYIDGGPPGRVAPVRHVEEPLEAVKRRVLERCAVDNDWEWACWVVNTDAGDEVARRILEQEPDRR